MVITQNEQDRTVGSHGIKREGGATIKSRENHIIEDEGTIKN